MKRPPLTASTSLLWCRSAIAIGGAFIFLFAGCVSSSPPRSSSTVQRVREPLRWSSASVFKVILENLGRPVALDPAALPTLLAARQPASADGGPITQAIAGQYFCRENPAAFPVPYLSQVCRGTDRLELVGYGPPPRGWTDPPSAEGEGGAVTAAEVAEFARANALEVVNLAEDRDFLLAHSGHFPFTGGALMLLPQDRSRFAYVQLRNSAAGDSQIVESITVHTRMSGDAPTR